jgi:hypothetical protein
MAFACTHSKKNQYSGVDIFAQCCILSLVLLAEADEFRLCGLNHKLIFETKKLFALVKCHCESTNMNKQIHALKMKLASLNIKLIDAKRTNKPTEK